MTTFIDGPAGGISLLLRRSPPFLRVTQNGVTFDALDQLDDEPQPTELIYVYQLIERPVGTVFTAKGIYQVARYKYFEPQPRDSLIRDNHAWRGWATRTWNEIQHLSNQAT